MVDKKTLIRSLISNNILLLSCLLILLNASVFLIPYIIPVSFSVDEQIDEISYPHSVDNYSQRTSYDTYDGKIFTIDTTNLIVYDDTITKIWQIDLSENINLLNVIENHVQILEVDEKGLYLSYVKDKGETISITVSLFEEEGLLNQWELYSIEKEIGTGVDINHINQVDYSIHLNTEISVPLISLFYHGSGFRNEVRGGFRPDCDSYIVKLLDNSFVKLRSHETAQCAGFFFFSSPDSYVIDGSVYMVSSATQNSAFVFKYNPQTDDLTEDFTLLEYKSNKSKFQ